MTEGQKLVGITFNPSNIDDVSKAKQLFADAIDLMLDGCKGDATKERLMQEAINNIITAQMWTVKAITWQAK